MTLNLEILESEVIQFYNPTYCEESAFGSAHATHCFNEIAKESFLLYVESMSYWHFYLQRTRGIK